MGWTGPKPHRDLIKGPFDDNLMSCLTKSPKPNPVVKALQPVTHIMHHASCLVETITLSLPDIRGALFWTQ